MKLALIALSLSVFVWFMTESFILAACSALGVVAFMIEIQNRRAAKQHRLVSRNWAEVLDSFSSAASAGLNPAEAIADLAEVGPIELRANFAQATQSLDSGLELEAVLSHLKSQLADANSDRTFELIRLTSLLGARGYLEALISFSLQVREQHALDGELAAKQGWVKGTAKLAVASPWVIVILLSARPENAASYNSPGGLMILAFGLAVCLFAYRLIHSFGRLSASPRVFPL